MGERIAQETMACARSLERENDGQGRGVRCVGAFGGAKNAQKFDLFLYCYTYLSEIVIQSECLF